MGKQTDERKLFMNAGQVHTHMLSLSRLTQRQTVGMQHKVIVDGKKIQKQRQAKLGVKTIMQRMKEWSLVI